MDAPSTKSYCNRETQRKRSHACDMTFGRSRAKSHEIHVDTGESKCRRGDPWKAPSECPQHVISLALGPAHFCPGHKVTQVFENRVYALSPTHACQCVFCYECRRQARVCHAEARVCGRSKSWMSTKNRQRDFNDGYSAKGSSARGSSAKGNSVIGNVTSPLTFHEMKNDFREMKIDLKECRTV